MASHTEPQSREEEVREIVSQMLRDELSIEINEVRDLYGTGIRVALVLGGETISSDFHSL